MTTVAYRAGVMAADTMAGGQVISVARKVFQIRDMLVGFAGNLQDGLTFVRWCEDGMAMDGLPVFICHGSDDKPDFGALVATREGVAYWTQHFQPIPVLEAFAAIGSGVMAARAAMHMGATAAEAVEVAMAVDGDTGGDIDIVRAEWASSRPRPNASNVKHFKKSSAPSQPA